MLNYSSGRPWSDSPNAPQIPYYIHIAEKSSYTGAVIAAILYGIVIMLFFQCMNALLNPTNHTRRGMDWILAAHTVAMFSVVTITTGLGLNLQPTAFVNNREFPGDNEFPPGPDGYKYYIYVKAISYVPNTVFQLNQWLADGLLLYRCYIIYGKNNWAISFPCLMYLASFVIGIVYAYQDFEAGSRDSTIVNIDFGAPYFSISLTLNVLLTAMIVGRLILHRRNIRSIIGTTTNTGKLCQTIAAIILESSALYAASFILFFVPWYVGPWTTSAFWPTLNETQVIAPLLIIRRVAYKTALTSEDVTSGSVGSLSFARQTMSTTRESTISYGSRVPPLGQHEEALGGAAL